MVAVIFRAKKTSEIPDHVVKCMFTEKSSNLLISRSFSLVHILTRR